MGLVTAFINQKGGVGKSTSSLHYAFWRSQKLSQRVLLVDADAQRTSSIWLSSLASRIAFEVIQSPDELLDNIPLLAKEWDEVIVDGPAGISEATRAILFRCDLAIVPCQPTGVDLQSATDIVHLIRQAQSVRTGPPKAFVFLSRAVKGTKLKREAVSVLSKISDIKVLKSAIHQKQAIADTFGQESTIWDLQSRSATESAREFEYLFKEIAGLSNQ